MRALVAVLAVSFGAEAKSLHVVEFEGKGAAKVQKQLESKLCRKLLCVEEDADGAKPTNVLYGKVVRRDGRTLLEVELRDAKGGLVLTQRVPVKGKTFAVAVDRAVRDALSEPTPELEEVAEQKPAPAPAPVAQKPAAVVEPAPKNAEPSAAAPSVAASSTTVGARAPETSVGTDYSRRIIWLGAGVAVQSRQLSYSGLATPELARGRELAIMPRASLALFPFARDGMTGIGVSASFASTVTSSPTEVVARQLEATLAFGLRIGSLPLWVRPEAGFRWHLLDGQGAGTEYRALKAGVVVEAALGPVRLHGQASYVAVLGGAGELSRVYFTRARPGAAFAGEVGIAVNVVGKLDVTLAGTYDLYTHALNADPGDLFVARSATDGYLGGAAGLRLGF